MRNFATIIAFFVAYLGLCWGFDEITGCTSLWRPVLTILVFCLGEAFGTWRAKHGQFSRLRWRR